MKLLTDSIKFTMNYKDKPTNIEVAILSGSASFKFENGALCKEAYEFEKIKGHKVLKYIKKENILIEFYPRMRRDKIRQMVIEKLKQAGGKQIIN